MKLKDIIRESINSLKAFEIEDSSIKVKLLIEYVLRISKEQIILNEEKELTESEILKINSLLDKIKSGVPIQYIINKQEFMGMEFYVNENVLIPQPDTEILVEEVIKYCNKLRHNQENNETNHKTSEKECREKNKPIKILDLCTGSGIIGVSLCKYLENVEIYISDISEKALEVAKKNAKKHNANINFICSDMFKNIEEKEFDIIVSNPPYIESNVINNLSKEVQNEPKIALDGGEDGLDFYRIISEKANKYLKENGIIFLEIGYDQKDKVEKIFSNYNYYSNIECVKDLSGNNRVIIVKK